jgi:hypothetical protein
MLVHQTFLPTLTYHTNEDGIWHSYDSNYCLNMKKYIKHQLLEKFQDIRNKHFIIHWPSGMLQKTIPLISAIWELGGIVVIHDLPFNLQYNPLFTDFYSKIDYILIESGSLTFTKVADMYGPSAYKLHEIQYWGSEQYHSDHDPIMATADNVALMVTGSGSLTAPKQTYFTHRAVINGMQASQQSHKYHVNEHVLHVRALHHSSAAVWFLFSTLSYCQHHYYKFDQHGIPHSDHLIATLEDPEMPTMIRLLLGTSITQDFLQKLKNIPKNLSLTVQSTESIKDINTIDQLYNTDQVVEFVSEFGCAEAVTPYMIQRTNKGSWATQRDTWQYNVFETANSDFYQLELLELGLGFKNADMNDFYVAGDDFKQLDSWHWQWLGRKNVIKRNGLTVFPQAIQETLSTSCSNHNVKIVADYVYKKIYAVVFSAVTNVDQDSVLNEFNNILQEKIDSAHIVDTVIVVDKTIKHLNYNIDPTDAALRFLARKKLDLDTEV